MITRGDVIKPMVKEWMKNLDAIYGKPYTLEEWNKLCLDI